MDTKEMALGALLTISLGLASWALLEINDNKQEISSLKEEIKKQKEIELDIKDIWRLQLWNKSQIDELRIREGLPLKDWPDILRRK